MDMASTALLATIDSEREMLDFRNENKNDVRMTQYVTAASIIFLSPRGNPVLAFIISQLLCI